MKAAASAIGLAVFVFAALATMVLAPQDELDAEHAAALSNQDAQQQAQHQAEYQRWAHRHCRNDSALWMQLEHGVLVCYDGAGQRLDAAVVARTEVQP